MKIGIVFGNPETTTGGNALKFYSSIRLDIRRTAAIKKGADDIIGNETKVKIVKNKCAPPFKIANFDIMYGAGISFEGELLELGQKAGVVEKAGAWYSYKGERLGQGKENSKEALKANADLSKEIELAIKSELMPNYKQESSPEVESAEA